MRASPMGMRLFKRPVAPGAITGSAWDTNTSNTSSDFTFSNSNRTITRNANTSNALAISTVGKAPATGSGYFEVTINVLGSNTAEVGVADNGSAADYVHDLGIAFISDGRINKTNSTLVTATSYTTARIGIRMAGGKFYPRLNGTWQGGCDGDALTGGFDITTGLPALVYPAASTNGSSTQASINTGGPFVDPLPVGESAWG